MQPTARHSQNNEQDLILNYFGDKTGTFLDIGANDGKRFSNTLALLEMGWDGIAVEPSPMAFHALQNNLADYIRDGKLIPMKMAIGDHDGEIELHESGSIPDVGGDIGLVSCIDPAEKARWNGKVQFTSVKVGMVTFATFEKALHHQPGSKIMYNEYPVYDFINIDCEGMDFAVLKQINLNEVGCKCFCIEHNSVPGVADQYRGVANYFGFREIGLNPENILFAKY